MPMRIYPHENASKVVDQWSMMPIHVIGVQSQTARIETWWRHLDASSVWRFRVDFLSAVITGIRSLSTSNRRCYLEQLICDPALLQIIHVIV